MLIATLAAVLGTMAVPSQPAQRAQGSLNRYFSADDYPAEALRSRAQGIVHFRLDVDAEGLVSNCTVLRSSGNAALDGTTCEVLRSRARYRPARDADGRAIAGTDEGRVTWALPPPVTTSDGPKPAERARSNLSTYFSADDYPQTALRRGIQGTTAFRLEIGQDGRVTGCTVTLSSGDAALDSATCAVLLGRAEYSPARDARGNAITGTDTGRVTWRLPTAPAEPFATVRAPVRIIMTLGADSDHRTICSVLVNGAPERTEGATLCGFMTGQDGENFMAHTPPNTVFTIDVAIGLDDAMPQPIDIDRGELLIDSTARLSIGPDGRVTDCEVTETNVHGQMDAGASGPPLCTFPAFEQKMFPGVPSGTAPRRGRIHLEMHLRLGGPRNA